MIEKQVLIGDAREVLRTLSDGCVQMVCTSPPYFGLRDYHHPQQIGQESTPDEYVDQLVAVFNEVRRVLRDDGTLWLNLGDSYAGSWVSAGNRPQLDKQPARQRKRSTRFLHRPGWDDYRSVPPMARTHLPRKNLLGIPWRVALALQRDGWILRSDIIWAKRNCLPESVRDRPTKSHEYVFLFAKSPHYFYDAEAIRESGPEWEGQAGTFARSHGKGTHLEVPGHSHASHRSSRDDRVPSGHNRWDVWWLATYPFKGAHFATMPPALVELCVLAGSAPQACEHCGAPWRRQVRRLRFGKAQSSTKFDETMQGGPVSRSRQAYRAMGREGPPPPETVGWQPTCDCRGNTGRGKSAILDPFAGSGTVLATACRLGRAYIGIELNASYLSIIEERIAHEGAPCETRSTSS